MRLLRCRDGHSRKLLWLIVWMASLLTGCGKPLASLDELAAQGKIDTKAPVKADIKMIISAPPAVVWAILLDAPHWTTWNTQIESISARQPLYQGMVFTWKTGGTRISSHVQLAAVPRRLTWTGTAFTAKAIHVWDLDPAPGGQTVVRVQESMDGPFIARFVTSKELADTDRLWLAALKNAAERNQFKQ